MHYYLKTYFLAFAKNANSCIFNIHTFNSTPYTAGGENHSQKKKNEKGIKFFGVISVGIT